MEKPGKIFGAFRCPIDFVTQLLEIASTRCFYEIIRADRECKAYFDLEVAPGVWNAEQGREKCKAVILEWERRVLRRWPEARQECTCCLTNMTLDGSRMTDEGWKVSYHVIYPWLVFPCNTTTLRHEVGELSTHPDFQYLCKSGVQKPFVDPAVYINNRQFQLLLNYKLSDKTQTALRLSSPPTLRSFVRSCITCIGPNVWRVQCKSVSLATHRADADSDIAVSIKELLRKQGHPEGRLISSSDGCSYRWEILGGLA